MSFFLEEDTCTICLERPAEELPVPCNHKLVCTKCSDAMRGKRPAAVAGKCMICNAKIEKILTDKGDKDFTTDSRSTTSSTTSSSSTQLQRAPMQVPDYSHWISSSENRRCPGCSTGTLHSESRVLGGVNTHQCTENWEECSSCGYKTSSEVDWD